MNTSYIRKKKLDVTVSKQEYNGRDFVDHDNWDWASKEDEDGG